MGLTHDQALKDEIMRQRNAYRPPEPAGPHGAGRHRLRGQGPERRRPHGREHGHPHPHHAGQKSTRNLATMLAEGSGQGVLDCKRAETDYPLASPGAHRLMQELCDFQTRAEQTWRSFI